jgi:hypothetical protein
MSLLMPIGVATAAYVATSQIPPMVGITTAGISRLGVKAAVGFGGGFLISKFLGKTNGAIWAIASGINLMIDILNTYLFTTTPLTFTGFSAFPGGGYKYVPRPSGYGDLGFDEFGAFPLEPGGWGAGSYPV